MKSRKTAIAISLLIIALGIAWLANVMQGDSRIDWFWPTGLGVSGILLLTVAKLDRFNFIVGVCLIVCSVLSILRQFNKLDKNIEVPVLFITVGVLLLLAHMLKIPASNEDPTALTDPTKTDLPK
jgi:hypothetical protein